jgi:hypothetical protein
MAPLFQRPARFSVILPPFLPKCGKMLDGCANREYPKGGDDWGKRRTVWNAKADCHEKHKKSRTILFVFFVAIPSPMASLVVAWWFSLCVLVTVCYLYFDLREIC